MPEINAPMMVIRKRLSAMEGAPSDTRYDEPTDTVETSVDGGATWTPNPGADPRVNPAYQLPPTGDGKCAAAAGMVSEIDRWITIASGGSTIIGLANALLGPLLFLLPVSWMFAMLVSISAGILLAGGVTIYNAFQQPGVMDQLLCIIYCNINTDGSVSASQLADIQAQIADQIGDAAVDIGIALMFQQWGHVGFTNAGVLYSDTEADCSACECCENYLDPMTTGFGPKTYIAGVGGATGTGFAQLCCPGTLGVYSATDGRTGGGCAKSVPIAGPYNRVNVTVDLGFNCTIFYAGCYVFKNAGGAHTAFVALFNDAGTLVAQNYLTPSLTGWTLMKPFYSPQPQARYICFVMETNAGGGACRIDDIDIGV